MCELTSSCLIPGCSTQDVGSLEHLLLHCTALEEPRNRMIELCLDVVKDAPVLRDLIQDVLHNPDYNQLMQLLLDCSVLPCVITLKQSHGLDLLHHLFYISRNWCYSIHRKRMNLLGLQQYRWWSWLSPTKLSSLNICSKSWMVVCRSIINK